jgi:hypothetical protein
MATFARTREVTEQDRTRQDKSMRGPLKRCPHFFWARLILPLRLRLRTAKATKQRPGYTGSRDGVFLSSEDLLGERKTRNASRT